MIDINADMGEGVGNDALLMPYISSANIACGYHAGDEQTMLETINLALKYNVAIGAHVSFHDRKNFGRMEMHLSSPEIFELVTRQLFILEKIAVHCGTRLSHVKPHGALYNMSAGNALLARTIAEAVKDHNPALVLFGLSGSVSIGEAASIGLKTANEAFADRTYLDDGSLTPRTIAGALIEDADKCVQQVMQMVHKKTVTTLSGKEIPIIAETICIHGDGKYAVEFAKRINEALVVNKGN